MYKKLLLLTMLLIAPNALAAEVDPTRPLSYRAPVKSVSEPVFYLQSIVLSKEHGHTAIINDTLVAEGQSISGYKVVSISNNSVLLSSGEKRKSLSLFSGSVKKQSGKDN
ncbi:hypothetical protein [Thalassotalea agarivorans]|uniref:MSHA biogenesis protein MshK n=1 Tax=Thalassotalea agarivorans TaxID=349064 RepID=A0A1I0G331_THASX|nr:hypothetical protein [Thalassotalea agarivorans]SET64291.1 MSHA biogenesis protein MshK [Thalassotalea agarivorans]